MRAMVDEAPRALLVSSIAQGAPLRVLPLGDSITYGYNDPTGNAYRRSLVCLLWAHGNPVELVGSVSHGDWPNRQSDAFVYHTIDEIGEAGAPELTRKAAVARPNIVLLHAGTVNFVLGKNVTNAPERLGSLVDFIVHHNPDAVLVVSQLIPNANATVQRHIDGFNAQLPAVVAERARQGAKVVLASMRGVTIDLLPDGTHPFQAGGAVMAQRFYEALVEAGRLGLVVPAQGPMAYAGAESLPSTGKCSDLAG